MSADLEQELREAFEHTSGWVTPQADLAERVRTAARRRRRVVAAAATIVIAMIGAVGYVAASRSGPDRSHGAVTGHRIDRHHPAGGLAAAGAPDALAASQSFMYVATGDYPGTALAAYDRATGRLVRRISIPAMPSTLRTGPDGLVWLAFYPGSDGGGDGVWLLSPDLSQRSVLDFNHSVATFDVLPTGPDSAFLATNHGLATVHFPPPGSPGRAALAWAAPSAIPSVPRFGLPDALAMVGGKAVVRQVLAGPGKFTLTFAGHARPVSHLSIASMAGQGNMLWATTYPAMALILLNSELQPVTSRSISASPLLAFATQVLTHGKTVWVIRSQPPYIACFRYNGQVGPIGTIRTGGTPAGLAVTGRTVYVGTAVGVGVAIGVASDPVPAACR